MMDQLVTPMNNGTPVEARDNHKHRNENDAAGKSDFRDTLSSVKAKDQQAHNEEPDAHPLPEGDDHAEKVLSAEEHAARLQRQRRMDLQAKAALLQNGQAIKGGKEALEGHVGMPSRLQGRMNSEDVAALLKKAVSVDDKIDVDELIKGLPQIPVALEGDETVADIVSNLLAGAEAASLAAAMSDKDSKVENRRGEKNVDRIGGKNSEQAFGNSRDGLLNANADDGVDFGADADATYRFNSVKGEGLRSLDMAVRSREGKIDFDVKEAGGRITENVTVLESRRFLGLATPTNSTALASLIANDSEWMTALRPESALLNAATQSSTGKVVHSLKLLLTPHDLGSVTVSLRMVGEELRVHMSVENQNAYRRLQEDNRSMMDALKAHGITVDQISISVSAAEKSDQTQGQNPGQQNGQINQDQENGKGAAGRKQQVQVDEAGGRDGQQNADIDHSADSRSSGVYL